MLDARFRPLPKWMRKPALAYTRSPFKTAYNRTLDKLESELNKLDARDIFIEAGFALDQIRNDGWPRGGMRPSHPGVVLYFTGPDGAMVFPCGTYGRFEENMHAIALTLENLRAIDRYGVTLGHQQYLGFAAIAAPPAQMSVEAAADFVAKYGGIEPWLVVRDDGDYRKAYRAAASKLHPDAAGNNDGFYKLGQAKAVLDQHHGLAKGAAS
jgi:hypothetical protein